MTELDKEIKRKVLELMYYIAANTNTNDEYESALSDAAIGLLDEAIAFDEIEQDNESFINAPDEDIWWGSSSMEDIKDNDDDDLDDDDLTWLDDWDYSDTEDDKDEEIEDDTDYRQQADGRVL